MIEPTIGRRVWFYPNGITAPHFACCSAEQPMDAGVVYVWNDRMVNLDIADHYGNHVPMSSVKLLQDDDPVPTSGAYATWMPYQKGQAAKVEAQQSQSGDDDIEREIQDKGLNAPRVTPAALDANIASEYYFTAADGVDGGIVAGYKHPGPLDLLTFCVLVLRNGFTVTGESACASPENFDAEIGKKIARANAVQKIWPLMGYALKEKLFQSAQPDQAPD